MLQRGSVPSIPQATKGALKEKVNLKKDVIPPEIPLSKVPEPVPARIPRPKISKYIPGETVPQSPDEVCLLSFNQNWNVIRFFFASVN